VRGDEPGRGPTLLAARVCWRHKSPQNEIVRVPPELGAVAGPRAQLRLFRREDTAVGGHYVCSWSVYSGLVEY
jgi:hypothetical protein